MGLASARKYDGPADADADADALLSSLPALAVFSYLEKAKGRREQKRAKRSEKERKERKRATKLMLSVGNLS